MKCKDLSSLVSNPMSQCKLWLAIKQAVNSERLMKTGRMYRVNCSRDGVFPGETSATTAPPHLPQVMLLPHEKDQVLWLFLSLLGCWLSCVKGSFCLPIGGILMSAGIILWCLVPYIQYMVKCTWYKIQPKFSGLLSAGLFPDWPLMLHLVASISANQCHNIFFLADDFL